MINAESTVMQLELDLLDPSIRGNRDLLDQLLADDFYEIGATGASFGKANVLERLPHESGIAFTASGMSAQRLADDVLLITYVATRSVDGVTARSKRCSIWVHNSVGWQMRYHQGTYSQPEAA